MTLDPTDTHDHKQRADTTVPESEGQTTVLPKTGPASPISANVDGHVNDAPDAPGAKTTDTPPASSPMKADDIMAEPEAAEAEAAARPDLHFLESTCPQVPGFPIDALPEGMRRLVTEGLKGKKTHPAFLVSSAIATLAGAVGTSAHLSVDDSWQEPCAVWTLLVGQAGTGKSVAMDRTVQVLTALGIAAMERAASDPGEMALASMVRTEIQKRTLRAIRAGLDAGETNFSAFVVRDEPAVTPALHTCSTTTLPGILTKVAAQPRGVLLAQADVIGLIRGTMMRTDEGRAALLQAYDGDPYIRDLATGPQVLPTFLVSVCGGVTPDKVRHIVGPEDDGMLSRCLVSYPHILRDPGAGSRNAVPSTEIDAVLRHVIAMPAARSRFGGHAVRLAEHSRRAVEVASRRWGKIADETEGMLASTYNRATAQALRLALVLAIAEHVMAGKAGYPDYVREDCARAAITLMDLHYLPSAERALDLAQVRPDPDKNLRAIARFIARNVEERQGVFAFNARALREARRAPCPRDHSVWAEAVDRLVRLGCVTEAPRRNATGRSRTDYLAHPEFVATACKAP